MATAQLKARPVTIVLASEDATQALAANLARLARPRDVIALSGDLGTGKTTLARAFINALPRPGEPRPTAPEEVPSPTFTLVQIYERQPAAVWHFDLYRLSAPEEVYELGFEEALSEAISLIEWPERLGRLLPAERLDVALTFGRTPNERMATLTGGPTWSERLAELTARTGGDRR